ncbi:MAG: hypothetical protein AAF217_12430 [Pseudomonadota bacterium]
MKDQEEPDALSHAFQFGGPGMILLAHAASIVHVVTAYMGAGYLHAFLKILTVLYAEHVALWSDWPH